MKKILLLLIIFFICINVYSKEDKITSLLKNDLLTIKKFFNSKLDEIKEMPVVLFPNKTDRDLVLLRRGFKKYYFIKSKISRIKVDFDGKSYNILKGFYKNAKIYINPCLIKRFPVSESYFYVKDLKINRKDDKITFKSIKFFFIADIKKLSEYVYKECAKNGIYWPYFAIDDGKIKISGNMKLIGMNVNVKGSGFFEISDKSEVYFKVLDAKFSFIPVPSFVLRQIMKKLNPIFAITKLPFNLYPLKIICYKNKKIGMVFTK